MEYGQSDDGHTGNFSPALAGSVEDSCRGHFEETASSRGRAIDTASDATTYLHAGETAALPKPIQGGSPPTRDENALRADVEFSQLEHVETERYKGNSATPARHFL